VVEIIEGREEARLLHRIEELTEERVKDALPGPAVFRRKKW
jgi:hypothetical protein